MKQVVNHDLKATKSKNIGKPFSGWKLDYELATLYEAIEQDNEKKQNLLNKNLKE